MTKILVWSVFISVVISAINYNDNFSKICKEAGGIPTMTNTGNLCLSVNSILDVE